MGFWKFYWVCIKRAFKGKFFIAEAVSGSLTTLAGGLMMYLGATPEMLYNISLVAFWIFLFVFVLTIIVGLIRAPYSLYKELEEERDGLKMQLRPRLEIRKAIAEEIANSATALSITLRNAGTEPLQDCKIVCKNIQNDRGGKASQEEITFGHDYQILDDRYGVFPLQSGEERKIEIARIAIPYKKNQFQIKGKGRVTDHLALLSERDYELEIYAYGSVQPARAMLRLYIDENFDPKIDIISVG